MSDRRELNEFICLFKRWLRESYSWPVDDKEDYIKEFTWPLSGNLIPAAPLLRTVEDLNTDPLTENSKINLRICRNGYPSTQTIAITFQRAVESNSRNKQEKPNYHRLELDSLLDRCSSVLDLTSAARRVFTESGEELTSLEKIVNNQLLFISTGEAWIPAKIVKEDVERKQMLANLADDLNKLAFFNRLKSGCQNLVIEALKGGLNEGTRLGVSTCYLNSGQLDRVKQGESLETIFKIGEKQVVFKEKEETSCKRAHDISHHNVEAEERKKFRWPWEKIANKSLDSLITETRNSQVREEEDDDDEDVLFDTTVIAIKSKPAKLVTTGSLKIPKLNSQKFAFDKFQGFIYSLVSPNLVLGVSDIDKNLVEVFLMKRNDDNPLQRWVYTNDGSILLKCRQTMALTVKVPSLDKQSSMGFLSNKNSEFSIMNDAPLILQTLISTENGNANQKWFIEDQIGLIFAFAPTYDRVFDPNDRLNIDMTAASKALICTGYVSREKEVSQPGYACQLPSATGFVLVCGCCGVAVRGKFKLTRLTRNQAFTCHFSKSNKYSGLKYLGGIGKVDLSNDEASERSFAEWKEKFVGLREMSSVVVNEKSLPGAVSVSNIIKLYAYRNGDGRLKGGELLIGTSLNDILEMATGKLGLNCAARRIYTQDGSLILDVQDLVTWCIGFYRGQVQALSEADKEKYTRQPKVSAKDLVKKCESSTSEDTEIGGKKLVGRALTKPNKNDLKRLVYEIERLDRSRVSDIKKVLKWPVEVWISCGEAFVGPEVVSMNEGQRVKQREAVDKAEKEVEKKIQELKSVAGKGEKTEQAAKQAEIEQLKSYVEDIKNPTKRAGKRLTTGNNVSFGSHSVTV